MESFPAGKVVIGKLANTALNSAPVALVFKDINGSTHTFAAGERLVIYEVRAGTRATAKDLTLFQDTDGDATLDAGEEFYVVSFAAAGIWSDEFSDGLPMLKINAGATNKFYAFASAAGASDVFVLGQVIKD